MSKMVKMAWTNSTIAALQKTHPRLWVSDSSTISDIEHIPPDRFGDICAVYWSNCEIHVGCHSPCNIIHTLQSGPYVFSIDPATILVGMPEGKPEEKRPMVIENMCGTVPMIISNPLSRNMDTI